eukprot:scaffold292142_cov17-Tisochrysis_lutea.AAC.1
MQGTPAAEGRPAAAAAAACHSVCFGVTAASMLDGQESDSILVRLKFESSARGWGVHVEQLQGMLGGYDEDDEEEGDEDDE